MPDISLAYTCGCTETWEVSVLLPNEVRHLRSEHPCIPEICRVCAAHGRVCPTRASSYAYPMNPITWSADAPPRRYTRRKT
jgi:hypothetical protein